MSAVLDLYPADVVTPQARFRKARLRLEDGIARVFVAPRGYVELAAEGSYTEFAGRPYRVTLSDGTEWEAKKTGGCGCSSPLKRFDPRTWGQ